MISLAAFACFPPLVFDVSFSSPHPYCVGKAPIRMVVADFNHDGKMDVATCNIPGHD